MPFHWFCVRAHTMLQQLQTLASDGTIHGFQTCLLLGFFSENRCMNGCNVLFAESRVEDCLELNFRYVDYQPLAHLSYSSYVRWRSVHETRVKCYSRVQVSINVSIPKRFQIDCSIDLCYIKIAVSESLLTLSHSAHTGRFWEPN